MTPSSSIFLTRWATVTTETPVFLARSLNDWRRITLQLLEHRPVQIVQFHL